jgi:hypothetical protein
VQEEADPTEYEPAAQFVQESEVEEPGSELFPARHAWQEEEEGDPATGLKVPAGHSSHSADPVAAYVPVGHSAQPASLLTAPALSPNLPAAQARQESGEEEPGEGLNVPEGQSSHDVEEAEPVEGLKEPGGHKVQEEEPMVVV